MTLATGQLDLSSVNTELGYPSNTQLTLSSDIVRRLAKTGAAGTRFDLSQLQGKQVRLATTLTAGESPTFTGFSRPSGYGNITPDSNWAGSSANTNYITTYKNSDLIEFSLNAVVTGGFAYSISAVIGSTTTTFYPNFLGVVGSVSTWQIAASGFKFQTGQIYRVYIIA